MAIGAADYAEALSVTAVQRSKELRDQVIKNHPILSLIESNKKTFSGSTMTIPVIGAELNKTAFATDRSATFSTAVDPEIVGSAKYAVGRPLVTPTRVVWQDLQENAGAAQLVNLAKVHLDAAVRDQRLKISQAFHAVGAVPAGQFDSLDTIVSNTGVLGGIDPATATYWKATRITIDTADMDIRKALRYVSNRLRIAGTASPNVVLVGLDVWEELCDTVEASTQYNDPNNSKSVSLTWKDMTFEGMTVRFDPDCPANRAYFLDTTALYFGVVNDQFVSPQEKQFVSESNTTSTLDCVLPIASLLVTGTSERRAHGLLIRTDTGVAAL